MMSVTEKALELLAALVERADAGDAAAVRIVARQEGWGIEMDQPRPEDETVEYRERTVLILDAGVADTLQESTLDVHDSPKGLRLRLR